MENYRYRVKVTKLDELKFISHLDWQNLILKSLRRMGLKLALSQGFNPTPKISFSPALPLFIESLCEIIYFETTQEVLDFEKNFETAFPNQVKLIEFYPLERVQKKPQPLETLIQWAQYETILQNRDLEYNIEKCLLNDNLFIKKINKKGFEKNIDYKNSLKSISMNGEKIVFILKAGQGADVPSLRADDFLKAVFGNDILFEIKRTKFFDIDMKEV